MFYPVSSPYLRVFGDDHVCGTRQQMMLQVDLDWESFIRVLLFSDLE